MTNAIVQDALARYITDTGRNLHGDLRVELTLPNGYSISIITTRMRGRFEVSIGLDGACCYVTPLTSDIERGDADFVRTFINQALALPAPDTEMRAKHHMRTHYSLYTHTIEDVDNATIPPEERLPCGKRVTYHEPDLGLMAQDAMHHLNDQDGDIDQYLAWAAELHATRRSDFDL